MENLLTTDRLITYNNKKYYWDSKTKKVKEVLLRDVDLRDCPPKLLEELLSNKTSFHNHKTKKPCASYPFVCHPKKCCNCSCSSYKKYVDKKCLKGGCHG